METIHEPRDSTKLNSTEDRFALVANHKCLVAEMKVGKGKTKRNQVKGLHLITFHLIHLAK